ncbi:MAG: hypothetical protein V4497_01340 [Bacteroidota bacterium]
MILADINVKWKFDYEMSPEEQTFHEVYESSFKSRLAKYLNNCGFSSNYPTNFDFYYFPQIRKFYLVQISINENVLIGRLKEAYNLKDYFIWEHPKVG